jgi:hypothetical protein
MTKIVYACKTTWDFDMGEDVVKVYDSIEALKRDRTCWEECGIVELEVTLKNVIEEGKLG